MYEQEIIRKAIGMYCNDGFWDFWYDQQPNRSDSEYDPTTGIITLKDVNRELAKYKRYPSGVIRRVKEKV